MLKYHLPYKICDSIHGFIRFDEIERRVIDSPFFQRLRYINQMGVVFLVYPGANHSRFEHSLGVMELATKIYETLMAKHSHQDLPKIPLEAEAIAYWRRIVRIAALCHDMGHLPFSHTAENAIFPEGGHERMTLKIIHSAPMRSIWKAIPSNNRSVEEDIVKLSVHEEELKEFYPHLHLDPWEKVLSQIITEDNFGADRMDYLIRDSMSAGVKYGQFDYNFLIDTLRILPSIKDPKVLTIGVSKSGVQSVESLWIARYLMSGRVYQHPKSRIFHHHMSRFMTSHYAKIGFPSDLSLYVKENDGTILNALYEAANKKDYDALTLLKQERSFQEVILDLATTAKAIQNLSHLQEKFKGDIFVDYLPEANQGERFRQFPVLSEDGKVILSSEFSDFLKNIPIASRSLYLFVHPNKEEEVKQYINTL